MVISCMGNGSLNANNQALPSEMLLRWEARSLIEAHLVSWGGAPGETVSVPHFVPIKFGTCAVKYLRLVQLALCVMQAGLLQQACKPWAHLLAGNNICKRSTSFSMQNQTIDVLPLFFGRSEFDGFDPFASLVTWLNRSFVVSFLLKVLPTGTSSPMPIRAASTELDDAERGGDKFADRIAVFSEPVVFGSALAD